MYRFQPDYKIFARPIDEYPGNSIQAKSIMLMIQNNLDPAIAQHPQELNNLWREWFSFSKLGSISSYNAISIKNAG